MKKRNLDSILLHAKHCGTMEPPEILGLLGSSLACIDGDMQRRKRVRALFHQPLPEVLSALSLLEREASDALSVRLIALAKQTLTGKLEFEDFRIACHRAVGNI